MNTGLGQVYMKQMGTQPLQYPEDEDGHRNVGIFAIQPLDTAGSPRRFYYYSDNYYTHALHVN
jgi:hypothetical protein